MPAISQVNALTKREQLAAYIYKVMMLVPAPSAIAGPTGNARPRRRPRAYGEHSLNAWVWSGAGEWRDSAHRDGRSAELQHLADIQVGLRPLPGRDLQPVGQVRGLAPRVTPLPFRRLYARRIGCLFYPAVLADSATTGFPECSSDSRRLARRWRGRPWELYSGNVPSFAPDPIARRPRAQQSDRGIFT